VRGQACNQRAAAREFELDRKRLQTNAHAVRR
jgi:hypothetical protein